MFKKARKIFIFFVYIFAVIGFILVVGYFAVKLGLTKAPGTILNNRYLLQTSPAWTKGEEWESLRKAFTKEAEVVKKIENQTGINSRMIIAQLVAEQLRLYHTNRELFKTIFKPLEILGNQSQFSWGVMGIKQETAIQIEKNLKDKTSPFYLGESFEHLLDFKTSNPGKERFERILSDDHYFSYLYTALYLKQIESQWQKAGYDISNEPGILSTLFNIGFENSKPNPSPQIGGSKIEINKTVYSFGALAEEFYYSDELLELFPRDWQRNK